jgi:hypothetical protein
MADNVIEQPVATTEVAAPDLSAQLKEQMDISLNINKPSVSETSNTAESTVYTPENTDAQLANTGEADSTQVAEPFSILKQKFNYENIDAAIKDIEDLRSFKEKPAYTEFVVPDDESGKILRALAAGKREEVWQVLDQEIRVERLLNAEVNAENAADIVKMGMQLKYKDLTPQEINYRFNKQFALPPEPKQMIDEEDADFSNRLASWQEQVNDKKMELMIEAKLAKPELQKSKANFVYPDIETPDNVEFLQYKKMLEEQKAMEQEQERLSQEVKAAYKAMTPKQVETKIKFKDEANKIDFEFQFEPDADGFSKAVEIASDADLFWKNFVNPDGSPNRQKMLDVIYYSNNKEKVIMSAMNQAKNAAIKAQLPDNSQGIVRQMPQAQEANELDTQMRIALRGYGGY